MQISRLALIVGSASALLVATGGCPSAPEQPGVTGDNFHPFYVYTANTSGNDVSILEGALDGTLTFVGKAPAGSMPADIIVAQDRRFVYVANSGDDTISSYRIGNDGRLSPIATVPTCATPLHLGVMTAATDPLDVSCSGSNEVVRYDIGADGTLTESQRLSVTAPGQTVRIFSDYFVPSLGDNTVHHFLRDDDTGVLSPATPPTMAVGASPIAALANLSFEYLFVLNFGGASVTTYYFPPGDAPRLIGDEPAGAMPISMTFGDAVHQKHLYVVNQGLGTVSHYSIETGLVMPVAGVAPEAGPNATDIAAGPRLDDAHRYVYVSNQNGQVRGYTRGDDGSLTFVTGYESNGTNVSALAVTENPLIWQTSDGGTGEPADMGEPGCTVAITSFAPMSGHTGDTVTLTGTALGGTSAIVSFNGTIAPPMAGSTDTSVVVQVPTGATTGPLIVDNPAFPACEASSASNFTVL